MFALIPLFGQVIVERPSFFGLGWSLGGVAIAIIVICALFAVVFIATRAMGVTIPNWVLQILGVLAIAFFAIIAIKLLIAM